MKIRIENPESLGWQALALLVDGGVRQEASGWTGRVGVCPVLSGRSCVEEREQRQDSAERTRGNSDSAVTHAGASLLPPKRQGLFSPNSGAEVLQKGW